MPAAHQAIEMLHPTDPKEEIRAAVADQLAEIEVMGARIMVAVYQRPEKTKGGVFLTQDSRNEDRYQGKVGLILAMGPLAFSEDATHQWGDTKPQIGDWVAFRVGDTHPFLLGDRTCRLVEDVYVQMILDRPDVIL